jgi:hypothetical protein
MKSPKVRNKLVLHFTAVRPNSHRALGGEAADFDAQQRNLATRKQQPM